MNWLQESFLPAWFDHVGESFSKYIQVYFHIFCSPVKISWLAYLANVNQHIPENKEQILNEILWTNCFIKIEKFSVYY